MDVNLLRRARVALEHALDLDPGNIVVLLTDGSVSADLQAAFVGAADSLGATVTRIAYTPVEPVAMREFGVFAGASLRPQPHLPGPAVAALAAADVAVILNSDMAIMFDAGLRTVIGSGSTRLAWAPYASDEAFLRLMPGSAQEWDELGQLTTHVAGRLAGRHRIQVTSPAGTDLQIDIGANRLNSSTGAAHSGAGYGGLEIWPGGQVSTVPDADTARGRLVIDRSINAPRFAAVDAPIECLVETGRVVDVKGGADAADLRDWLSALADDRVYHLTEFGVGTNRRCRLAGVAGPCEDTHTLGCVSFALGADVHLGGTTAAPCHVDMTMHQATVLVDDQSLIIAGQVQP